MSKLIKDWKELSQIPNESDTHILTVDTRYGNALLIPKEEEPYIIGSNEDSETFIKNIKGKRIYLSTHSFYRSHYEWSSRVLQACGFDVQLVNWG